MISSIVTTGRPSVSVAVSEAELPPPAVRRTRSAVAPVACRVIPLKEKGTVSSSESAMSRPCRAASRTAGCSVNPSPSMPSGRAISA
ncbi:hypothetical protein ADK96_06390 [Streptomyces sp. IGB124]|nr:hypothetical protein ADK96_06390 [Streptomyces sp. IGB124]